MFMSLQDMTPTFAQVEGKLLSSVSARVKMSTIQKCANIMYKHFVTGHRQLCACAFPFHQLEKCIDRKIIKNCSKSNLSVISATNV